MFKNDDIILIKETNSEYIDKIIVILNDRKKDIMPRDIIVKQAENIIFEYQQKNPNEKKSLLKRETLFLISSTVILLASLIYFISGMQIF